LSAGARNTTVLGICCALAAASFYGLVTNFVRGAYNNGISAAETGLFRTGFIGLVFAMIVFIRGERFRVPRGAWKAFVGQALATLAISICYLASVQFIPVGLSVIIFFMFPIFIMIAAPLVEGHAPGIFKSLTALVAFTGLVVAIGPSFGDLDLRGVGLAFLASLGGMVQFFTGRILSKHMTPPVFGSLVHIVILPAMLIVAFYTGGGRLAVLPGGAGTTNGFYFVMAVALVYATAYMLQMLSLRFAPASTIAPFFNLEPVVTTTLAGLLFAERLTLNQYAGGGIVLAVLVISSIVDSREAKA
jgi:drug/metabolite transporter (DMT)-like permease